MKPASLRRSVARAAPVCALAALTGLAACGDDSHYYSYDAPIGSDAGTYRPPARDAAVADACATCGGNACVDLSIDVANCGRCGLACPGSAHGAATCAAGACGLACDAGFEARGGKCERVIAPPRPVAPLSGATTTSARPSLRWSLAPTTDGAAVDLCPTRACDRDVETYTANGDRFLVPRDLAPGVHYWRLHGRAANASGVGTSPTWELFVGHRSAPIDTSAGAVGDFNGDGYADVVIADPAAAHVYVYWGGPKGIDDAARTMLTLPPGTPTDSSALAVANAGDLDGDGFPDLVIGDAARSRIHVYRGSASGLVDSTASMIVSPIGNVGFGAAIAAAGDIDGDGYGDLVVGMPGANGVRVYRGGPSGISNGAVIALVAPEARSSFGVAVAGAGDVDGDGYADIVVGAPGANAGAGRVYVYAGGPTMLARAPTTTIDGPDVAFGGFGSALAIAGDVNGDGFADVLVGAPDSVSRSGRAYVFFGGAAGLSTTPGAQIAGAVAGDALGATVAAAGDVDGDGFADVAIGSPGVGLALGHVDVYRGSASGLVLSSRVTLASPDGENFGAAIGGGADLDGDGFADLVVGARTANHAYVFRGAALGIGTAPSVTLAGPDTATRTFGRSVAMLRRRTPART